jgi:2-hydroxycyclohexanecarboxyl-CoA dehydrogenase
MTNLEGKVAIVTGGGQGVGRGIALALAKEGAKVVICGRHLKTLRAVKAEIQQRGGEALAVVCDVSKDEDIQRMVDRTVKKFGTVDILVNNAQTVAIGPVDTLPDSSWDVCFETGPKATWRCCKAVFPYMKTKGGKIINLASHAGDYGEPLFAAYGAAKGAIQGFTRCVAREWGQYKINVNVIIPSAAGPGLLMWRELYPEEAKKIEERSALGAFGDAEMDIGRTAVFLASEDSRFITGHTLMVDGGRHMA